MGRKRKLISEELTEKEKKLLMRRMHKFLDDEVWEKKFGWSDNFLGVCAPDIKVIYFNIYIDLIETFIHEYLHAVYPEMKHRMVYKMESKIFAKLTNREIKNLAKKIMLGRKITLKDFEKIPYD